MAGPSQNMQKMWTQLQNKVDLDDPGSHTDQVYLGCTQRAAQVNNIIVIENQILFSMLISTSTDVNTEEKNPKDITVWSWTWKITPKSVFERYCELAHKTIEQHYKVSIPCLNDHQIKPERLEIVGELSQACSQIVLQCLYGKNWKIRFTLDKLVIWPDQSQKSGDLQLARIIATFITQRKYKQYCHIRNQALDCRFCRKTNRFQVTFCAYSDHTRL